MNIVRDFGRRLELLAQAFRPTEWIKSFLGREFIREATIRWMLIAIFIVHLASWVELAVFVRPVEYDVILHYNIYFGVAMIGAWQEMYILPVLGLCIMILNCFFAFFLYRYRERVAAYIILLSALMAQVGILIACSSLILVNYY